MEKLCIEATRFTPKILFDAEKNMLEIRGESYPENTADFYAPVFSWVESYLLRTEMQKTVINMELTYFNSSSSKVLLDLFDMLEAAATNGKDITVNWIFEEDDEESQEFGKEFQEDFESVTFNLIQKEVPRE